MKLNVFAALLCAAWLVTGCGTDATPDQDTLTDVLAGDSNEEITAADAVDAIDDVARDTALDTAEVVQTPGVARFIHISDVHFRVEEGGVRNNEYIDSRVSLLNAIQGDFDYVISTGDNFDHILPAWNAAPLESPMMWYVEQMDTLRYPWLDAIGNHEFYDFFGDLPTTTTDGEARRTAFSTAMGHPMYYTQEVNGVKLIILDSMEDGLWAETHGLMGSFSTTQIDWLRSELAQGKPSILFFHHPPSTLSPLPGQPTLCDVLTEYPNTVKGIFDGHLHGFWKGEFCGSPYFTVVDFNTNENQWFEVEYDGPTDTLTILNEEHISFPVLPEFTCEPGESTVVNPELINNTIQKLIIEKGTSDATGIGEMLGEGLGQVPFAMSFGAELLEDGFNARLTIASEWEVDGFWTALPGSPCVPLDLHYKDGIPCVSGGPVTIAAQLIPFLAALGDEPVDPDWEVVLEIKNLTIEGKIGNDVNGIPIIAAGLVYATVLRDPALDGMKQVLVTEYCKGLADGCPTPGEGGLPVCPEVLDKPAIETVYTGITGKCDFIIQGFGVQMIIDMLATLPPEVNVTGEIRTEVMNPTATVEEGGNVFSGLFDTTPGSNCEGIE